ncbi:putative ribonuclease H-like domain-containing protein [Tanacetum coccineum]
MDLKWQLALLSMRARRYFQRTGKKITINGSDTAGYDKSKTSRNLMEDMLPLGEEPGEEELLMCDKKNSVLFTNTACFVLSPDFKLPDESQVLLKVPRKNNMYRVDMKNIVPKESLTCLVAKATLDESMLWHRRLGHINFKTINKLGKQHKASCKSKIQNSITQPLFMLHMDLFGLTFVSSLMNKKYCLVVTDDYSRFTWVFFLASKDETSGILKNFIIEIENLVDKKVKIIRCDNRTEFKNCEKKGIKREFSIARTPQQNGVAERRNRTLIEAARTMLADSKLPTTFWAEAVNIACYVQNRFDGKSDDGFFVGYSLTSMAFRVYDIRTRKVEENLHIRFLENKPIVTGDGPKWLFDIDSLTKSMNYVPVVAGTNSNDFAGSEESNAAGHTSKETEFSQDYIVMPLNAEKKDNEGVSKASGFSDQEQPESSTLNINTTRPSKNTTSANFKTGSLNINIVSPTVITTRSNRSQNVSDMFSLGGSATLEATHADLLVMKLEMWYTIWCTDKGMTKNTNEHGFISAVYEGKTHEDLHTCLFACFLSQEEPKRIAKALSKRAIGTKWIFKNKKDERGIVTKNKARLVSQGYIQEKMDVKSAFLYGTIEEEVYVCQPLGFEDPDYLDKVYKVVKALYGLHQALRAYMEPWPSLQVKQREDGIFINQDKYVAEILRKFGFTDVRTASTPIDTENPLRRTPDGQDTKIPQSSGPPEKVGDEAVHKELGDKMERVATTASSLDAEQDSDAQTSTSENGEMEITATIDGRVKTVTKASIRRHLKLEDSDGISTLPNTEIFEQLALMGTYIAPTLTHKLFSNMRRASKGFTEVDILLFPTMLVQGPNLQGQGSTVQSDSHHTTTSAPSTSQPPTSPLSMQITHVAEEAATFPYDSPHPRVKRLEKEVKLNKARRRAKIVVFDDEDAEKILPNRGGVSAHDKAHSQGSQPEDQLGVFSIAKIFADVARVHTYSRRRRTVSTCSGEISTAKESVSTTGALMPVSTAGMDQGSIPSPSASKDKGKAIMTEFEPKQATTKLKQRQEIAGYEAAIRLQEQLDEEESQRIVRDAEVA